MFIDFVAGLVILTVAFHLVNMALAFLLTLVMLALSDWPSAVRWNAVINQIVLATFFGGMMAVSTRLYASQPEVVHVWLYAVTGFLATYLILARGVQDKLKRDNDDPSSAAGQGAGAAQRAAARAGAAQGAAVGVFLALALYPIFFAWPSLLGFMPGSLELSGRIVGIAGWLTQFWLVRTLALMVALGHLFSGGLMLLLTVATVGQASWTGVRELLGLNPGSFE